MNQRLKRALDGHRISCHADAPPPIEKKCELRAPYQVLERDITDVGEIAAVAGVVAVIANNEAVTGRDIIDPCGIRPRVLANELRKAKGTSKPMIPVPPCDLKFLIEFAARDAGTSNRRQQGPPTASIQFGTTIWSGAKPA